MCIKKQFGFTVVEGLLLIIAITLIVGVGYFVWNAQKDNNVTSETVTNSTNLPTANSNKTTEEEKYLVVKELGIRIPLNADLEGMSYSVIKKGVVALQSEKLNDLAEKLGCNGEPKDQSGVASVFKKDGVFKKDVEYEELYKQFDTFYLSGWSAVTECSNSSFNEQALSLYDKLAKSLKNSIEVE